MANDFNIKVKHEGIKSTGRRSPVKPGQGQQSLSAIQKGIARARKRTEDIPATFRPSQANKEIINSNRKLITSIKSLITSNKSLEKSVSRAGISGGGGAGLGRAVGGAAGAAGGAVGRIGGALPLGLGVPLALAGFAISKITQIGNAYIDLASQQKGTAALGGFQRGQGMYTSAEMGGGMAAYARGTGRFATAGQSKSQIIQRARQVATGYGLSLTEAFGQAGAFERVGGQGYGVTAARGAAGGIQADMQVFLSGIAGTLEEAMTNGIDASNLATDMSKNISALTKMMPGQSAAAALRIAKTFQGVKESVGRGEYGSYQKMLTAQAAQDIVLEKVSKPEELEKLRQQGRISDRQYENLRGIKGPVTTEKMQKAIGPVGLQSLIQDIANQTDSLELMKRVMTKLNQQFGTTIEGRQAAWQVASRQGWVGNKAQFDVMYGMPGQMAQKQKEITTFQAVKAKGAEDLEDWEIKLLEKYRAGEKLVGWEKKPKWIAGIKEKVKGALDGKEEQIFERYMAGEDFINFNEKKWLEEQKKRSERIESLPSGMAGRKAVGRENLVLDWGEKFAETSINLEKNMIKMANSLGGSVGTTITGIYDLMKKANEKGGVLDTISEVNKSLSEKLKSWMTPSFLTTK